MFHIYQQLNSFSIIWISSYFTSMNGTHRSFLVIVHFLLFFHFNWILVVKEDIYIYILLNFSESESKVYLQNLHSSASTSMGNQSK